MNPSNPHAVKDGGSPIEELFHIGLRWRFFSRIQDSAIAAGLTGPDMLAEALADPGHLLAACSSFLEQPGRSMEETEEARTRLQTLARTWEEEDERGSYEVVPLDADPHEPAARVSVRLSLQADVVAQLFENSVATEVPVSDLASGMLGAHMEDELAGRFVPVLMPIAAARRLLQGDAAAVEGGAR